MGVWDRLRGLVGGSDAIRVHVLIRGRIGDGWHDIDQTVRLRPPATLADLLERGERDGIPFAEVLAASPHLRHTLMLNGSRCPVEDNRNRELHDGDEVYLLAPLAGG